MWATVELLLLAAVYAAGSYQGSQNAINSQKAINAKSAINRPLMPRGLNVGP
jgi:TctA family transporter